MQASAYFVVIWTFAPAFCATTLGILPGPAADNETTLTYDEPNVSQSQPAYNETSNECFKFTSTKHITIQEFFLCNGDVRGDIMTQLKSSHNMCGKESCNTTYVGVCPCRNAAKCEESDDFVKTPCLSPNLFEIVPISNGIPMPTTSDAANVNSTTDSMFAEEEYPDEDDHPLNGQQDYTSERFEPLLTTTTHRAKFNTTSIAPNLHASPVTTKNGSKKISTMDAGVPGTRPIEDISTTGQQTSVVEETSTSSLCFSNSMATTNDASTSEYEKSRRTSAGTSSVATDKLLQSTSDALSGISSAHSIQTGLSSKGTKLSQSTTPLPHSSTTTSTQGITVSMNYDRIEESSVSKNLTTSTISQTHVRSTNLPTSISMSPSTTSKTPKMAKSDTSATRKNSSTRASRNNRPGRNYITVKQNTNYTYTKEPTKDPTPQHSSSTNGTETSSTPPYTRSNSDDSSHPSTPTSSSRQVVTDSITLSYDGSNSIFDSRIPKSTWTISLSTSTATSPAEYSSSESSKASISGKIFDVTSSKSTRTIKNTKPISSTDVNGMSSAVSTKIASTESTSTSITSTLSVLRVSSHKASNSESPAFSVSTTTWYQSERKESSTTFSTDVTSSYFTSTTAKSSSSLERNFGSSPTVVTHSRSSGSATESITETMNFQEISAANTTTRHSEDALKSVAGSSYTTPNPESPMRLGDDNSTTGYYSKDPKTTAREDLTAIMTKLQPSCMATTTFVDDDNSFSSEPSEEVTESKTASTATTIKDKSSSTFMAHRETLETTSIFAANLTILTQSPMEVISNASTTSTAASISVQDVTRTLGTASVLAANLTTLTQSPAKAVSNASETLSASSNSVQDENVTKTLGTASTFAANPTFLIRTSSTSSEHATTTLPSTTLTTETSTTSTTNTVKPSAIRGEPNLVPSLSTASSSLYPEKEGEKTLIEKSNTVQVPANEPLFTTTKNLPPTFMTTLPVTKPRLISTSTNDFESSQHKELQSSSITTQSSTNLETTTTVHITTDSKQTSPETVPKQITSSQANEKSSHESSSTRKLTPTNTVREGSTSKEKDKDETASLNAAIAPEQIISATSERGFHEPSSTRKLTTADIVRGGNTSKEKDKNKTAAGSTASATEIPTIKHFSTSPVLGVGSASKSSETEGLPSTSISDTTRSEYGNSNVVHTAADNSFATTTQKVFTKAISVDATPSTTLKNTTAEQTSQFWYDLSSKEGITTAYLSSKSSLGSTTSKPSPAITWLLHQSTTSSEAKSDNLNKPANFTDGHETSSSVEESQSTVEEASHEKIPLKNQRSTSTWITSTKTATSSLQECQSSCSPKYQEGPYYCYRILSAKESTTYRRALKSCQDEDGELADEVDFRNAEVVEALEQVAPEKSTASAKIYVNERGSELITKRRQVRLITLKGTTRFFLNVAGFAGMNEISTGVYGVCRRKKNCEDVHCHLDDYDTLGVSSYLVMPGIRSEMLIGEKLQIPCAKSESKSVEVTCGEKGALDPLEIGSICGEDQNSSSIEWEAETSLIRAELKSCSDCHVLGTSNCQSVNGSYSCVCKPEWSGHTCWKSPDQCRLMDVQCGANGTCISAIDKAYCECDEGFSGERCDVISPQLSFYSKTKSSILSAANAGVLVVSAGEILIMIVKGLTKLHFPKSGEDTQVFCQNMRSLLLSVAGFIVLFFHHPALFNINAFACSLWLYLETTCYSLSIGFFTLESQNVYEVVYGNARRSQFWDRENKTPYEAPPVAINSVAVGLILGIGIAITTAAQMNKLVTNWSCMGHFTQQTLNIWLPIVIFNTCAALTATCFAYKSYFIYTKIPQYRHKTDVYLKTKQLDVKSCIEKCYRNLAFVAMGPWLLLATWITLALSFDWVTVSSINLIAMIVSFSYTACNFLQSAFTNPNLYSKYVRLAMKFCPRTIAPQIDPVTMWTRDEVLKKGDVKSFLPSSTKDRLRIQWMRMYAKTKIEQSCSKSEALYSVCVTEMGNTASGASLEQAEQIRRLNQEWVARTHRKDPQPDPARRTNYEAELDRLTRKLCDAWNGTQALKKTRLRNADERNEFLIALKNYLEVNDYDPFEYCPLTMVDGQGNTKAIKCLKKPAETLDPTVLDRIQCESRAIIDDVHKRNERKHNYQQFDPQWLLVSDQEKKLKRLQDYENDVWNMAKQNYDYMCRVKAL